MDRTRPTQYVQRNTSLRGCLHCLSPGAVGWVVDRAAQGWRGALEYSRDYTDQIYINSITSTVQFIKVDQLVHSSECKHANITLQCVCLLVKTNHIILYRWVWWGGGHCSLHFLVKWFSVGFFFCTFNLDIYISVFIVNKEKQKHKVRKVGCKQEKY